MRPTKNRYFCYACMKTKMLFESEEKAMAFIRYNQDEMAMSNGHAPVRAYYCNVCMGWHVTSNPNIQHFENYKSRAEKALDLYRETKLRATDSKALAHRSAGDCLLAANDPAAAARRFLTGYHSLKAQSREDADGLLREAFRAAGIGLSGLMDGETVTKEDIKPYDSILKMLRNASSDHENAFADALKIVDGAISRLRERMAATTKPHLDQAKIDRLTRHIEAIEAGIHDSGCSHEQIRMHVTAATQSLSAHGEDGRNSEVLLPLVDRLISAVQSYNAHVNLELSCS